MTTLHKDLRSSIQNWITDGDWQIFGTLNFATRSHLRNVDVDDVCGKMWRSYFNTVDRALFGRQRHQQHRFQRSVFVHHGSYGDNPHIHFLANLPLSPEDSCILLGAVWSSMFAEAASPTSNEITPIQSIDATTKYGLHEYWGLISEAHDLRLSSFDTSGVLRDDALAALKSKASNRHLLSARLNYPHHVRAAAARKMRKGG